MLIDVAVYGIILILGGIVTLSTPEWTRNLYVKSRKNRKLVAAKRVEWQQKEKTMGYVFIAAGVVIILLRIVFPSLVVDALATIILFAMILWRTFSFLGG
jgi:hypothetical protein